MKVLFDSNVIIDAISARDNAGNGADTLFLMAISKDIDGFLLSKQITDIYYVLRRYMDDKDERITFIGFLLKTFEIINIGYDELFGAKCMYGDDFEDDLISFAAEKCEMDYIATSNMEHFNLSYVKAGTPREILSEIEKVRKTTSN